MNNLNNITQDWTHADQFLNDKIDKNKDSIKHDFGELTNHVNTSFESVEKDIKMLNGVAEGQFITDSDAKMVKVVPENVNKGIISMVGGKTQKMVQLFKNNNFNNTDYWTTTKSTVKVSNNIATWGEFDITSSANGAFIYQTVDSLTEGHKYLSIFTIKANKSVTVSSSMMTANKTFNVTTSWGTYSHIAEWKSGMTNKNIPLYVTSATSTDTINIKDWMFFDLTAMFSAGKEPTEEQCLEFFKELVPTGSFLYNAPVKKVVSLGVNKVDPTTIVQGTLSSTGEYRDSDTRCVTDFIPVKPGKFFASLQSPQIYEIHEYDSNKSFIKYTTANTNKTPVINTDTRTAYIRILIRKTDNAAIVPKEVRELMLMFSDSNDKPYVPYNKTTLSLERIINNLPDYGASVDDEYNYIDFENMVYHHRVSTVDLGTLTWNLHASYPNLFFSSAIGRITDVQYGCECTKYSKSTNPAWSGTDDGSIGHGRPIAAAGGGSFVLKDTKYSNATTLKENLKGVYANYKITEELIPLTDLLLPFKCEPGGTVTFENEHNLDVPNTVIYEKEMK